LQVLVGNERGQPVSAPGLARWLARVAPVRARGTISLAIVSDRHLRALNRQYLGRDYATDVLSFPAEASRFPHPQPPIRNSCLGDIVIARGVARQQARRARHSEQVELRVLALHGLLHLLGYDHERDQGEMQREERRLRRKGGLREGLIERARPAGRSTPPLRAASAAGGAEPFEGRATCR
jgi:probable rRNA maturation factor